MKKSLFAVAVFALVLAGCAHQYGSTTPDPAHPQVSVSAGKVSVDQEVIKVPKGAPNFRITWHLPGGSPYQFDPTTGIAFDKSAEQFSCTLGEGGQTYVCTDANTAPGRFKYTVNVRDAGKPLAPLDPFIDNG